MLETFYLKFVNKKVESKKEWNFAKARFPICGERKKEK